jgi:hypothetical protein
MSDILKSLLQAYWDAITVAKATTLSMVIHHEVSQAPLFLSSTWHAHLPAVLIQAESYTLTPDSFEGSYRSDLKVYTIKLSGYVEYYDENFGIAGATVPTVSSAVLDLAAALETVFNRQTFGLSQACVLTGVSFSSGLQTGTSEGTAILMCELTFAHTWIDRRLV